MKRTTKRLLIPALALLALPPPDHHKTGASWMTRGSMKIHTKFTADPTSTPSRSTDTQEAWRLEGRVRTWEQQSEAGFG